MRGKVRDRRSPAPKSRRCVSPLPACRVDIFGTDNVDAGDSLTMLLRLGHEVDVCRDGVSALAAVESGQPEVVLLDLGLPGMDGYEVARRLRSGGDHADLVLVALTGYGREEDIRRSQEAGFDHHLVKPADLSALNAIISRSHRCAGKRVGA
jgi:two-component system, chemotaxis family, CheB/CheR fusion protein